MLWVSVWMAPCRLELEGGGGFNQGREGGERADVSGRGEKYNQKTRNNSEAGLSGERAKYVEKWDGEMGWSRPQSLICVASWKNLEEWC